MDRQQKIQCYYGCIKCRKIINKNLKECDSVLEAVDKTEDDLEECLKTCKGKIERRKKNVKKRS